MKHDTDKTLLCILLVVALPNPVFPMPGSLEPLFSPVQTNLGPGFLIVDDLARINIPKSFPTITTIYTWGKDAFLSETHFATNNELSTNVLFAAGIFHGTNWEYRDGKIVLVREIADTSMIRRLGGMSPEQGALDQILGMGLSVGKLKELDVKEGIVKGRFSDSLTLTGWATNSAAPFQYAWGYIVGGLKGKMQMEVKLQAFRNREYLPVYMKTMRIEGQRTNVYSEVLIRSFGTNAYYKSLSPFALYGKTRLFILDKGVVTDAATGMVLPTAEQALGRSSRSSRSSGSGSNAKLARWLFIVTSALGFLFVIKLTFGRGGAHDSNKC